MSSPTRSPSTTSARAKYDLSEPYSVGEGVIVTRADRGVILEKGPSAEVIGSPTEERTRQFLDRILNPL